MIGHESPSQTKFQAHYIGTSDEAGDYVPLVTQIVSAIGQTVIRNVIRTSVRRKRDIHA
jgi:hypothetical protein